MSRYASATHARNGCFAVLISSLLATVTPDQKFAHLFVDDKQRDRAVALHPDVVEPLRWGRKVVGVRVALAKARVGFVQELVRSAWARKAPKSLSGSSRPAG